MGISRNELGDGERVVVSTRTHWKVMIFPVFLLVVVVAAAAFGVSLVPAGSGQLIVQLVIVAVALVILLIWTVWPFLNWVTESYVVTDQRLITRTGVITRKGRDIPLGRLNDVQHERGLTDRILGCGTLIMYSAAEEGPIRLTDIPHVERVQRMISELLFQRDGVNDPSTGGGR